MMSGLRWQGGFSVFWNKFQFVTKGIWGIGTFCVSQKICIIIINMSNVSMFFDSRV